MNTLKKGDKVRLKNDIDLAIWCIKINEGIVLETRSYGPIETMVTADFGNRRVHIANTHLEVANEESSTTKTSHRKEEVKDKKDSKALW